MINIHKYKITYSDSLSPDPTEIEYFSQKPSCILHAIESISDALTASDIPHQNLHIIHFEEVTVTDEEKLHFCQLMLEHSLNHS